MIGALIGKCVVSQTLPTRNTTCPEYYPTFREGWLSTPACGPVPYPVSDPMPFAVADGHLWGPCAENETVKWFHDGVGMHFTANPSGRRNQKQHSIHIALHPPPDWDLLSD